MRVPYAVHMHGALTGYFIGAVTRRVRDGLEPPPRCVNVRLPSYESNEAAAWRLLRFHTLRWVDQSVPRVDQPQSLRHRAGALCTSASRLVSWMQSGSFRGVSGEISGIMSRGIAFRGRAALIMRSLDRSFLYPCWAARIGELQAPMATTILNFDRCFDARREDVALSFSGWRMCTFEHPLRDSAVQSLSDGPALLLSSQRDSVMGTVTE